MFRKTFIGLLLLVSSVAVADGPARQGVVGMGVVGNEDGKQGHFTIRAAKVLQRSRPQVEGNFRFVTGSRDNQAATVIEVQIERLNVRENTAHFAGKGVLSIRRGSDVRRFAGILEGTAVDRRNPRNEDSDARDGLRFVFDPRTEGIDNFAFGGAVREGDIRVAIRSRD